MSDALDGAVEPAVMLDGTTTEAHGAAAVARDLLATGELGSAAQCLAVEEVIYQLDRCEPQDVVRKLGLVLMCMISHAGVIGRLGDEAAEAEPGSTATEALRRCREQGLTFW